MNVDGFSNGSSNGSSNLPADDDDDRDKDTTRSAFDSGWNKILKIRFGFQTNIARKS